MSGLIVHTFMEKDKEHQLEMLQNVFEKWMPPTPAFKDDHKGVPEGMVPYISCRKLKYEEV